MDIEDLTLTLFLVSLGLLFPFIAIILALCWIASRLKEKKETKEI